MGLRIRLGSVRVLLGVALIVSLVICASIATRLGAVDTTRYLIITVPVAEGVSPVTVSPITTFQWTTLSGNPDPAEYRHILVDTGAFGGSFLAAEDYIRNNPAAPEWCPWQPYSPPDTGTYWTTPWLPAGYYVFGVQGRDAAGNAEQEFDLANLRRVSVLGGVPTDPITWGRLKALYGQ